MKSLAYAKAYLLKRETPRKRGETTGKRLETTEKQVEMTRKQGETEGNQGKRLGYKRVKSLAIVSCLIIQVKGYSKIFQILIYRFPATGQRIIFTSWPSLIRFSKGNGFSSNTGAYRIVGSLLNSINLILISNCRALGTKNMTKGLV